MKKRIVTTAIVVAAVLAVVFLWRALLIGAAAIAMLVAAIALLIAVVYAIDEWRKWRSLNRFRYAWGSHGKDLLLVYSDSPHWQRYIEETWLPKWSARAVVLNWSERKTWERSRLPEAALFRAHAGRTEFNPLAIVVPPSGRRAHVVRFWRAFRDAKHGKDRLLRKAEAELAGYLGIPK